MQTKKETLLHNLNESLWDLDTAMVVMEARKTSRNHKGETMNFFALKVDRWRDDDEVPVNELDIFLNKLHENIHNIAEGTRIQLAVQSSEHWFPMDIEVREGSLSVLIPEAAFTPSTAYATFAVLNRFSNAAVYRFYPDTQTTDGEERDVNIQKDGVSCSRFALQQLFALQKIPHIHQVLQDNQPDLKKQYVENIPALGHYGLSFSNCPPEIAAIFKSTQDFSGFELTDPTVLDTVINQKGETLDEYHRRHTQSSSTASDKLRNEGITAFKRKQIDATRAFLSTKTDQDLANILEDNQRMGVNFLSNGQAHRDQHQTIQQQKKNLVVTSDKQERNLFLKKVNEYCRDKRHLLDKIILTSLDPKTKYGATVLKQQLESLRTAFMVAPHAQGRYLGTTYQTYTAQLLKFDNNLLKKHPHGSTPGSQRLLSDIHKMTTMNPKASMYSSLKDRVNYLRLGRKEKVFFNQLQDFSALQRDERVVSTLDKIKKSMFDSTTTPDVLKQSLQDMRQHFIKRIDTPHILDEMIESITSRPAL